MDVLTTKTNISIFHKGESEVVVRLQGILYKDGKKEKEVVVDNVSLMNKLNSFEQTFCSSTKGASSDSSNFGSPIKNCFNFERISLLLIQY